MVSLPSAHIVPGERFWTERGEEDALEACGTTYQAAAALEKAAQAHDDEGIASSRKAMFGGCQACHTAHREEKPGGGYLIK